ncbi:chemotaxis protein CheW [Desulfonema magnum]|uniref:Chemotaxis protein, CheW/CheV-like n=1 Tax=Desulfonema magnum TaxID=45655 RepID=A0A975BRV4_9BACT|nr:chemotaxis protein CheW [Desulfonema magnum]QTA90486.1 Chemotaxis protein, CheW/CheV-like [Desulfonema magnum]
MKKENIDKPSRQFCTFQISERLFGVDILDVKEVNQETDFTPIFHAPKKVKGYVNIRGQIHLILDLRLFLGFESKKTDDASRVILFKPEVGDPFGVLVDQIGDVFEVDEARIEERVREEHELPEGGEQGGALNLLSGVCKLENGLLVILNSRSLLKNIW